MIILWVQKTRKDKKEACARKGGESFQEHAELMKQFRLAHPDLNIISATDILTAEGDLLAPVRAVKLADNARN